jgi:hypothetical protein
MTALPGCSPYGERGPATNAMMVEVMNCKVLGEGDEKPAWKYNMLAKHCLATWSRPEKDNV